MLAIKKGIKLAMSFLDFHPNLFCFLILSFAIALVPRDVAVLPLRKIFLVLCSTWIAVFLKTKVF